MPTVAEQLRHAREQQDLNVYQVAEITKIKTDHIRALEAGQYETFSAPVYIRGFVRTYARALKLDETKLVSDLDHELGQTEKFRELPPLTDEPRGTVDFLMLQLSKMNWKLFVSLLGSVLAIVLVVGWLRNSSRNTRAEDPLKNLGPGMYQPRQPLSGDVLPLPTNATRRP